MNKLEIDKEILSNITVYNKYARYDKTLQRRETFEEIVDRNMQMHIKKYPQLKDSIEAIYKNFVLTKKVLPSMRSLQFGGAAIIANNSRIYNCAYMPIDNTKSFSEGMFLLLGGSGVGYSVQNRHISKLPSIIKPLSKTRRYVIEDSIMGWADAIKVLFKAYTGKLSTTPLFDFSQIREKGAELVTAGGKAPGPEPLKICLIKIEGVLKSKKDGEKLTDIECHDIMCHIADAVLAGGIRRAAMISLFDMDSEDMLTCKAGAWWENNPQRGRANNSAVIQRHLINKDQFDAFWEKIKNSGSGEPGFYLTNDPDWGTNPCCEIGLRPYQFCNLCEVNGSVINTQEELEAAVSAAAFIGTLQAGYIDFHYLRDVWREATEKDALIGVSMTGIASKGLLQLDFEKAAKNVVETNKEIANLIGINPAARTTCVKPAGTTSLVLGTSSGIHAWHNDYYIRRMRIGKNEPLYHYLAARHPELVVDDVSKTSSGAIIEVPQKAPESSITRHESAIDLLERVKLISSTWVKQGHIKGQNTHNVSCTVSLKDHEWDEVREWMWENREIYNGLSVLPYDGGTYIQPPFEDCSKEEFERRFESLNNIDLSQVIEEDDNTSLSDQAACAGGACTVE